MTCNVHLQNGSNIINIPVIADSGSQFQLLLESTDVTSLGFTDPTRTQIAEMPNGEAANVAVYGNVMLILSFDDGTTVSGEVLVSVLQQPTTPDPVAGVPGTERILGFPALSLLGVKLDFKRRKLVRLLRMRI